MSQPFAFEFGDPAAPPVALVESPTCEPGTPHDGDHEWHEVVYVKSGTLDPDFVACSCGQMARKPRA